MAIKVIPVEVAGLIDVVRLVSNVRRERSLLLSIPRDGGYDLGFYLPPQIKGLQGVYVYTRVDDFPSSLSYSPNDAGQEVLKEGFTDSPTYINIPVVEVSPSPHEFVDIKDFDVELITVSLRDLRSMVHVAYSTTLENVIVPFVWYLVDDGEYVLNVDAPSDDDKDYILLFRLSGEAPKSAFIEFDPIGESTSFVDVARDVTKKYLLVVNVVKFMV